MLPRSTLRRSPPIAATSSRPDASPDAYFAFVVLAFAALAFSLDLSWSTAALALRVGLLGVLAFVPFAALFTAAVLAFKQAPGTGFVVTAISLVSGLYFPVQLLPGCSHSRRRPT